MAHHKRGRPKNRRAGCLMCKPHKANGSKGTRAARTNQDRRSDQPRPPDRPRPRSQSHYRGRKPFTIEARWESTRPGEKPVWSETWNGIVHKRYRSERDRDQALAVLRRLHGSPASGLRGQFRKGPGK